MFRVMGWFCCFFSLAFLAPVALGQVAAPAGWTKSTAAPSTGWQELNKFHTARRLATEIA
jgi:hypothetical protein